MSETKEQILSFMEACNELKKCKFIMAPVKIKDILKSIVNSPDLYNLFNVATRDFNYLQEKSRYLITVNDGYYNRSYVAMPQEPAQILAFSLCLLVEFDNNTLDFNDFLRRYFPEDGSYFSSFHAFCNTVIKSMQDTVMMCFKEEMEKPEYVPEAAPAQSVLRSGLLTAIDLSISEEKQFISTNAKIPDEEKEGALAILTQLFYAVKNDNRPLINALVCGYNYFVLYNNCLSDGVTSLLQQIAAYGQSK